MKISVRDKIKAGVARYGDDIVGYRRHLHAHPETGYETKETERFVREILNGEGIEILPSKLGVIAMVRAGGERKPGAVALRADMDALPLQELNEVCYKSSVPGKMHACGHDGHTAMLLGAARIINSIRGELEHDVIFFFQPAEEGPFPGGAAPMLEEVEQSSLIKEIEAAAALHLTTEYENGKVIIRYGSAMASTDEIDVEIIGKGGHVGLPHKAIDALSIAAEYVKQMESFMSRRIDPFDSAVFGIGRLVAGTVRNIIPERAEMQVSLRCQREETRAFVLENAEKILKALCESSGADYTFEIRHGLPVLVNDRNTTAKAEKIAAAVVGDENIIRSEYANMGAEDFAFFSRKIPSTFIWVGAANKEKGLTYLMHNPRFDFDEEALSVGTELLCGLAVRLGSAL